MATDLHTKPCDCLNCVCTRSMASAYALTEATRTADLHDRIVLLGFTRLLRKVIERDVVDEDEHEMARIMPEMDKLAQKYSHALKWVHLHVAVSGRLWEEMQTEGKNA